MSYIKRMYVDPIVDMFYQGYSNDEIAKELDIPEKDVESITNEIEEEL